jgi:hypothetical protein
LLKGHTVQMAIRFKHPTVGCAVTLTVLVVVVRYQRAKYRRDTKETLTIILFGKPGSKGIAASMRCTCTGVREMSSAVIFSLRCSTFLPPMMGNT